jgi:hypothetical protein
MVVSLENANPTVFNRTVERVITSEEENDSIHDAIDSREIFDILPLRFLSILGDLK